MFKITGMKDGARVTVTWDRGSITPYYAGDHVRRQITGAARSVGFDGFARTPFLQECEVSIRDSVYCYWQLGEWFDDVELVEGETGVIDVPEGAIQ